MAFPFELDALCRGADVPLASKQMHREHSIAVTHHTFDFVYKGIHKCWVPVLTDSMEGLFFCLIQILISSQELAELPPPPGSLL